MMSGWGLGFGDKESGGLVSGDIAGTASVLALEPSGVTGFVCCLSGLGLGAELSATEIQNKLRIQLMKLTYSG